MNLDDIRNQRQNIHRTNKALYNAVEESKKVYGNSDSEIDQLKKDVRKLAFALRDAVLEIRDLKTHTKSLEKQIDDTRLYVNSRSRSAPTPVQQSQQNVHSQAQSHIASTGMGVSTHTTNRNTCTNASTTTSITTSWKKRGLKSSNW